MPPFWRALAEGSGGSVWTEDDVLAAIVPMAPERSVFNSVFYGDGERLLASLDRIAGAYDEAGVNAWTVWVPEADERTAAGLGEAGHVLDAEPRAMGMEISELRAPEPDETVEFRDELDMAEVARLNEIAYGWAPGEFDAVAQAEVANTYAHFASLDGETVGTVVTWDHGDDSEILWVATLPEARGRGISKQLMARAITAAGGAGASPPRWSRRSWAGRSTSGSAIATSARSRCGSAKPQARLAADGYVAAVARGPYSDEEIDAAIEAISDPAVFRETERQVARVAPRLQRILAEALGAGGWFGESHEAEVLKAATAPDEEARLTAVRTMLAEEARMGMMVGVAVGWALAERLEEQETSQTRRTERDGDQLHRPLDGRAGRRRHPVLIDPFLKPNNPAARVTAEEVNPTHVFMTHAHMDHYADAVAVGKRTGASFVAITELANVLGEQGIEDAMDANLGDRHLRLGLGEAGPGPPHQHRPRLHRPSLQPHSWHRDRRGLWAGCQHRRQDPLPPRRHRPVQRLEADRGADPGRDRLHPDRRALHDASRGRGGGRRVRRRRHGDPHSLQHLPADRDRRRGVQVRRRVEDLVEGRRARARREPLGIAQALVGLGTAPEPDRAVLPVVRHQQPPASVHAIARLASERRVSSCATPAPTTAMPVSPWWRR